MSDDRVLLETRRTLSAKSSEGVSHIAEGNDYGEQFVVPMDPCALSLRGCYYTATTVPTTAATGVAGHPAPVAYIDTKPFLYVKNNQSVDSRIRMRLDYLSVRATAIGAGGTLPRFWMARDAAGTNRYTSGGTELALKVNANGDVAAASSASIFHGAVVAPAASSSQKVIKTGQIRPVIEVIYDEVIFTFGRIGQAPAPSVLSGTLVSTQTIACPPVIICPQETFLLHFWRASQSGANSYEVDMGWVER